MGWTVYDLNGNIKTNALGNPVPVTSGGTGTSSQFTQGSVVFAGASGVYSQNNSKFFWDNTNFGIGLGTNTLDPDSLGVKFNLFGATASRSSAQFTGNTSDADATAQVNLWFSANSNSGGADKRIAYLTVQTDGSTANNRGGRVAIYTKNDGGFPAEQLRIDQAGLTWAKTSFALGATPATAGGFRVTYASPFTMRSRLNDANITLLGMGSVADDDFVEVGDNSQHAVSKPLGIKFYPGSGVKMELDANGNLGLGVTSPSFPLSVLGVAQYGGTASGPGLRYQVVGSVFQMEGINYNNNTFNSVSLSGTGNNDLLVDTSGNVTLLNSLTVTSTSAASTFKTTTALVSLAGGSSTPAFVANSVGAAGQPTTAAQNSWLKATDSTGATIWIPVWK